MSIRPSSIAAVVVMVALFIAPAFFIDLKPFAEPDVSKPSNDHEIHMVLPPPRQPKQNKPHENAPKDDSPNPDDAGE